MEFEEAACVNCGEELEYEGAFCQYCEYCDQCGGDAGYHYPECEDQEWS